MHTRTVLVALVVVGVVSFPLSTEVFAQACNDTKPNQPTQLDVTRSTTNPDNLIVTWQLPASLCPATKVYVEASRGAEEVIEADTSAASSGITLTIPKVSAIWRIAIRSFNEFGLSAGRSVALDESSSDNTNVPAPNPCTAGAIYPPTLISANVIGRVLTVQWQPNTLCAGAITGFTLLGQFDPAGPVMGTVQIPYPNIRVWSGEVPPGSYHVSVMTRFYQLSSPASNTIFVHVP